MLACRKLIYLPIIAMMAFFGLVAFYTPVHAEDAVPPVSDTPAESQPETQEAVDSAESPVVESAPTVEVVAPPEVTEEAPLEVFDPSPTQTPSENVESAPAAEPEPQTPSTGLATDLQVALGEENSNEIVPQVVVIDETGNSIPMVTTEAAEALVAPDPYFFVGTTKYSFMTDCSGVTNCTEDSNPLQKAFDTIASKGYVVVGGAVYVEANTELTPYGSLFIDGSNWGSNPIPVSLSLIGYGTAEKPVGSSANHFIDGTFSVTGLKSFTLQGFTIKNEVIFDSNTGTLNLIDVVINGVTGNGLKISSHSGPVNLNMVDASDNTGLGASISNTAGTAAPVTIKNSTFNRNSLQGLLIHSNGAVSLTGVSASFNKDDAGANITSKGLTVNQSIFSGNTGSGLFVPALSLGGNTLIQNSQFLNNSTNGLKIVQNGNVDIKNVRSSGNGTYGMYLGTCLWDGVPTHFCSNPFSGNVSILQSEVTENGTTGWGTTGIYVSAKGSVTITDTNSGSNGTIGTPLISSGAEIYNNQAATAAPVNITNSSFNKNNNLGLLVNSKGMITLKDVTATDNNDDGVYLDNQFAGATAGVSILNTPDTVNLFANNNGDGLNVISYGPVVVTSVRANGNYGGSGIYVNNSAGTGAVTIDGARGTTASVNGQYGIQVISKGLITVKNMDATENGINGYDLNNQAGTAGVSVLATIPGWHNGLQNNHGTGLNILSSGAVIVQKTYANNNQHYGATIDNTTGTAAVTITDSEFSRNARVDVSPADPEFGLSVKSRGNIVLTNSIVNHNGYDDTDAPLAGSGASLDNHLASAAATVTITKSSINENTVNGLVVSSMGAVSFKTGGATRNYNEAVIIDNSQSTINQSVTIDNINVSDNGYRGLVVVSKGNIIITATDVNSNGYDGTHLDNTSGTGTVSIAGTPSWWRYFGNNLGSGLEINTNGAVTISYVSFNDNQSFGAKIDSTASGATASVTLNNVNFFNNALSSPEPDNFALDVKARGVVILDNVQIADNRGYGASIDNCLYDSGTGLCTGSGAASVTIKSANGTDIRNNLGYGLQVTSRGNITLTNIQIHDNGLDGHTDDFGAVLDNRYSPNGSVTINNTMYTGWQNNKGKGLEIDSKGAVTINRVYASRNNGINGDIDNTYATGTATPAVTITNSEFNDSQSGSGLNVNSKGNITLTNVDARDNNKVAGAHGANINNAGVGGKGTVTISGTAADDKRSFNNNSDYGLLVLSNGAITIKFIDASNNNNYGAVVNNSSAVTPQAVSITEAAFINNSYTGAGGYYGLKVFSKGNITATRVFASNNGNYGESITGNGMLLDNCLKSGDYCTGTGFVTMNGSGGHGNFGDGLTVRSYGAITLSDVGAGWNNENGGTFTNNFKKANPNPMQPDLKSTAGVTLSLPAGLSTEWGIFGDNGGYGLDIRSNGAVSVAYVNVTNNRTTGNAATIDNSTAATPMAVTITKSKFNNNNDAIRGILVNSKGAITFSNNEVNNTHGVYADNQGAAELDNCDFDFGTEHCAGSGTGNVTVTSSIFNNNGSGDGLLITSRGNVLLTNVSANFNAHVGLEVITYDGVGTITVNGTRNSVFGNSHHGANLVANGNIVVTNITSENNTGYGLFINPQGIGGTGTGTVTVTNANLNKNRGVGIRATSNGPMSLTNVTALGNGIGSDSSGAYLITNNKDITITNSSFTGNYGAGIWSDTGSFNTLKLIGTSFIGNDVNKTGEYNLYKTGNITIN